MGEIVWGFEFIMVFTIPAYVLPLILGPIILIFFRRDELSQMAALFSLKPLLATPLWVLILAWGQAADLSQGLKAVLGLIPGLGLTLAIVLRYRPLLRTEAGTVSLLLGGDALRWLNTFFLVALYMSLNTPLYAVGLILPNAYALMALVIVWLRKDKLRYREQVSP